MISKTDNRNGVHFFIRKYMEHVSVADACYK